MGRILKWLIIILLLAVVVGGIYFGFNTPPLQQTVVEQPVDRETLGI
ncbi:hypothetical protein [Pacificimonas flava]|uniref:Uncharacterized protein n=1 Tax=Pacificimonas flava TaxID=1234595 RepID=M2U587_9SPHN|nr:hypothetical protein [Pacificimonas flava]EMD83163.1 hypothetical protein C725_1064 [Pacificimonas flava]MBB5279272.1 hypothetical protein [Pacificimonas flava]